jgi:hypothetical protein
MTDLTRLQHLIETIPAERKELILKVAGDAIQMLLLEIEEGDSSETYKGFTKDETEFFWIAILDAVSDSTDD